MSTRQFRYCENCGTANAPTGKFCSQCGEPLDLPAPPTSPTYGSPGGFNQPFPASQGGKLQVPDNRAPKSRTIIISLSLLVIFLLISVGVLIGVVASHQSNQINPVARSTAITQTASIRSTVTPTPPYISWNSSHTDTSGGRPALTISGPVILEGDDTVNGTFQGDGLAKEGTLIVLLDSTPYTIRSDNQGTEWVPVEGIPTRTQIDAEVGSIVDQMKSSKDTCSGGCTGVKVVYFQGGRASDTKTF